LYYTKLPFFLSFVKRKKEKKKVQKEKKKVQEEKKTLMVFSYLGGALDFSFFTRECCWKKPT
jgi:hypothetical protein